MGPRRHPKPEVLSYGRGADGQGSTGVLGMAKYDDTGLHVKGWTVRIVNDRVGRLWDLRRPPRGEERYVYDREGGDPQEMGV